MPKEAIQMEKKTFTIPNINCGHCVMTIQRGIGEIEGVQKVEGDPKTKQVKVSYHAPATLEKIKLTLKDLNYPSVIES
jgi:copper chaperone CopZ